MGPRLQSTNALAMRVRGRPARAVRHLAKPNVRHLESAYFASINALVDEFNRVTRERLFQILEFIGKPSAPKFDDPSDVIERTFSGLRIVMAQFFDRKTLQHIAGEAALKIESSNKQQFRRLVKTVVGIDPMRGEPWLIENVNTFVKENVSLIKTIPAENLSDIEQMLYRDSQRRLSPQEMRKNIVEKFSVTEARAELIATDQVLKFNSALTEHRQRDLGVRKFIWRNSGDERVRGNPGGKYPNARPSHWALEGEEFSWDKPPVSGTKGERLPPGMPIRCRCYAEPVLDDLLK